jgi:hypothetical protein
VSLLLSSAVTADHEKRWCYPGKAARLVRLIIYALDLVREAMSRLYAEGTQDAVLQGNPVERALRNIHAIVFDLPSVRPVSEAAGRVFLGGEPQLSMF